VRFVDCRLDGFLGLLLSIIEVLLAGVPDLTADLHLLQDGLLELALRLRGTRTLGIAADTPSGGAPFRRACAGGSREQRQHSDRERKELHATMFVAPHGGLTIIWRGILRMQDAAEARQGACGHPWSLTYDSAHRLSFLSLAAPAQLCRLPIFLPRSRWQNKQRRTGQCVRRAGQVSSWVLTNALLDAHLAGSDTEAIGGDLAYRYGLNGGLTSIGLAQA